MSWLERHFTDVYDSQICPKYLYTQYILLLSNNIKFMTELKSEVYILYYILFQAKNYIITEANFRTTFSSNELYNETPVVLKSAFQNLKANYHLKHNQVQ